MIHGVLGWILKTRVRVLERRRENERGRKRNGWEE